MTVSSIISNPEAYSAQSNIHKANDALSTEVAQLSSGNRIQSASYDVAALSIGTDLKTQVNTLNIARQNTSLGTSMLQVADGALATLQSVLQDMQAIATQANSGSLTSTQHGFLDQKFQSDLAEINSIVGQTNFNGVNLLDGSLSGVGGNFLTTDPAAESNYVVSKVGDSVADPVISAIAAVAPVDGTNGLNPDVIGSISNVSFANVGGADDGTAIRMRMTIGGVLFEGVGNASNFDTTDNDETSVFALTEVGPTFNDSSGSTNDPMKINVTFQENTATAVTSLATFMTAAGTAATTILQGSYISQQRNLSGFTANSADGTALQGLTATPVLTTHTMDTAAGDSFGNVDDVSVTKVGDANDTNGQVTVTLDGQDFILYDLNTATGGDGILAAGNTLTLTHTIGETNTTETLALALTGTTGTINVNTQQGADALASALRTILTGTSATSTGGLSFQVGTAATDTIGVTINNVDSSSLFAGASPDVLTQSDAAAAATLVSTALNTVTAVRANVGALQSRFSFAAANLDSSIQNQDSARGQLLDTDIAATSTSFAISQVQLQAGISVLAQANQQLQGLIKLLG